MSEIKGSTADRILIAALQLMKDNGFKSVTIKEIAQASEVSEMTVFRHFETKRGVLEAAIKKNSQSTGVEFKQKIEAMIQWDLEQDLQRIAEMYFHLMEKNESICLIAVQERFTMPELVELISKNTERLKQFLAEYFREMQKRKKMIETDIFNQATVFFTMLFGYFLSTSLWGTQFIQETREQYIAKSVHTFCNGIKK